MTLNFSTLNARGLKDPSMCSCLLGEFSMLLQSRRLTSLVLQTVRCWRMTMSSFEHMAAVTALGSLF